MLNERRKLSERIRDRSIITGGNIVNSDKGDHLNENQIILAMVEEADLPLSLREHLSICAECQASKERFEQELARLGRMAELLVPDPEKRVSLPPERPRSAIGWFRNWRSCLGVAAATALVIIAIWWFGLARITPERGVDMLAQEKWEADPLMTEIGTLVENALPQVYLDISVESDSVFDEEFMQFFIPPVNNDSLSYNPGEKGERLC